MAIEALTYELLEAYLAEVPNSAMMKWTPKKIMDELSAVDPLADQTVSVSIGIESIPGVPSDKMEYIGTDTRFTAKWANKAHNALSNFLHEPTIADLRSGKDKSEEATWAKAHEIMAQLDAILASSVFNVNFGEFVEFQCGCGFHIKRKAPALNGMPVVCGNCGLWWVYETSGDGQYRFQRDKFFYTCASCNQQGSVDAHKMDQCPIVVCACGAKAQVAKQYTLTTIAPPDQKSLAK